MPEKGGHITEEHKATIGEAVRRRWADPAWAERTRAAMAAAARPPPTPRGPFTEEEKAAISERLRGLWRNPDYRARQKASQAMRPLVSRETRQKVSDAALRRWANPTFAEPRRAAIATEPRPPLSRQAKKSISEKARRRWEDPAYRARVMASQKGAVRPPASQETRDKISRAHMGMRPTEETREKLRAATLGTKRRVGLKNTPEAKANMSRAQKKVWQRPGFAAAQQGRMKRGQAVRPTGPERVVWEVLDQTFPGEWAYVGDGSVVIDGLFPDFIHEDGQRLIIEVFGDYWHREDVAPYRGTEKGRIEAFAAEGYRTLVIWESQLTDMAMVEQRVREFAAA